MKTILTNDHVSILRDKLMEYLSGMHLWFFILSTNGITQGSYGNISISDGLYIHTLITGHKMGLFEGQKKPW